MITTILLFRIEDGHHICLLLLAGSLAWIGMIPFRQWTLIDIFFCMTTAYELVSCYQAECTAPALLSLYYSVFCLTAYFLLRRILVNDRAIHSFRIGSYLSIGVALILAIGSFFVFRHSVLNAGFEDTYHYRFLFRPLGYITNVWAEVLILLLGWICLLKRYATLLIFMCILAILLSFSRGAYLALSVFLVTALWWIKPRREKVRLLIITLTTVSLTASLLPKEFKTTVLMNRTVSQRQSTDGRKDATQAAWNAFCKQPLLGYGSGNFTYAIDHELNQDSTRPSTSFAPNTAVLLLVEKGIAGTILYVLLVVAVAYFIWKHRKQAESRIAGCTLLALLVKDMTQATLLCVPFTLFMFYVWIAFLQNSKSITENDTKKGWTSYLLPSITFTCFIAWNIPALQSVEDTPKLVNEALTEIGSYWKNKKIEHLDSAEKKLKDAIRKHPADMQIRYLQARTYLLKQEMEKAEKLLKELSAVSPKNSLYLVALTDAQYQQEKKEKALHSFTNAVCCTPRLLHNERIRIWAQNDSIFYKKLVNKLSSLGPNAGASPSDYARYGYIAHWCGNPCANKYLKNAITALPNLATPWRLLGDEQKYRLLTFGAFQKNSLPTTLPEEKNMTDSLLLDMTYAAKFNNWYGLKLNNICTGTY